MCGELFEEWLHVLNIKFHRKEWKVVMIIDNCPAHPYIENVKAMTVVFLPKNTTSITQPIDQGIIRSLEAKYCTILVCCIITVLDNNKAILKVNIVEAMYMLTKSWDQVSTTTIVNFF